MTEHDCLKEEGQYSLSPKVKVPVQSVPVTHREKIIEYLQSLDGFASCWKIAKDTGIDNKICSNVCNELYQDMILDKPFRGSYQIRPEHRDKIEGENKGTGLGFTFGGGLPRVQNLRLEAGVSVSDGLPDVVVEGELYSIEVRFGVTRGRITVSVGCDIGLDPVGLELLIDRVNSVCLDYGFSDLDWWCTSYELFTELYGVYLSGVKIIRFRDLQGNLVKLYTKPYGSRREVRSSERIPWDSLLDLVYGNPREFNYRKQFDRLAGEVKENNKLLGVLAGDVGRFSGLSVHMIEAYRELSSKIDALTEASR